MKKTLLFVLALILVSVITNANENPSNDLMKLRKRPLADGSCFDENTRLLSFGLGVGGFGYYRSSFGGDYVYSSSPTFLASYEQAYPKKLGPGYLGIGAVVGFKTAHSRYDNYYYMSNKYYYEHRWNYFTIASRGAYHWDVLNKKNAEVYGGVVLGLRITSYTYKSNSNDPNMGSYKRSDGGVDVVGALFAGARWYFVPKVSVYGEVSMGYSMPFASIGISFKL